MNTKLYRFFVAVVFVLLFYGTYQAAVVAPTEETMGDAIRVEEGSLYPALYRMEKRGWIEAEWGTSEIGRKAKVYKLIAENRADFVVPADYTPGSQLDITLKGVLGRIARDHAGYRGGN